MIDFNLKSFTFGKSTAEGESEELRKYFIPTIAYRNAKTANKRKVYYIGHRGSGKSALFSQLKNDYIDKSTRNIIIEIEPTDFSYTAFRDSTHDFYDVPTVYGITWYYTILIEIMKKVLDKFKKSVKDTKTNRQNRQIIKKYLEDKGYLNKSGITLFIDVLKGFDLSKLRLNFDKVDAELSYRKKELKLLKILNFEDLQEPLSALNEAIKNHPVFIFIDELDIGWNNIKEAQNYISGLFFAVNRISVMKNIFIFTSLRQDMYNNLLSFLKDTEKMRDNVEYIRWDNKGLRSLIAKRIISSLKEDEQKSISYSEAIKLVFDDEVLNYIIENSLKRPREIIQFCTMALEQYNEAERKYAVKKVIDMDIVKEIQIEHAINRFEDFCKEFEYEYPGLKKFLSEFEYSNSEFTLKQFEIILEKAVVEVCNDCKWVEEIYDKIEDLIEILFVIGFIKVKPFNTGDFVAFYDKRILNFKNLEKIRINNIFSIALSCNENINITRDLE